MILNRLALCVCSVVSFSVALIGCQPNVVPSNMTALPAADKMAPTPTQQTPAIKVQAPEPTKATTLQWASHYQWQLAHVKDQQGNPVNINTANPIALSVAPSSLSLSQGCQHFIINFRWMQAPPFEYGSSLNERPSDCKNSPENKISETNIKALLPKDNTLKLDVELLPLAKNLLVNTQLAPKNLVIKIENGNTLTFDGKPKVFKKPTGLPIDKALLERYDWKLKSAVHNTFDDKGQVVSRQPISDFYFPNHPILLEFRNSIDSPYVAFNSGCNGSSAPYFLLRDNTLKVSNILSSAMNCGETGNRIETALFDLMRNSSSKLTLSLQLRKPKLEADFPRYNLLQTMESGETLVWQNEIKDTP